MGLFDFRPGEPTWEAVERRRKLAEALQGQIGTPRTFGEGLSSIGSASGAVIAGRGAEKMDAERTKIANAAFNADIEKMGYESPLVSALADPPVALAEAGPAPAAYGITPGASTTFPASLIETESGGNWSALNSEGYGGRLQFGKDRLADAARAGVIPAGMTGADFSRLPPEAQQRVEQWHFADIDRQAEQRGLTRYIGQTVGGIPITQDGIRAMAHLGGIGGAAKFLNSGGKVNPADSNGTSLADYAARHGGQMTAQPTAQPAAYAPLNIPPAPQVNVSLIRALNNPYMSPEQRQVLATIYQQQQANQITPYQQAQLALQQQQMAMQGQITPYQAAQLSRADAATAWEREQAAAAAQREQQALAEKENQARIKKAVAMGMTAQTPEEWDRIMMQAEPSLVGGFAERNAIAASYMDIPDVMAMQAGPEFRPATPEEAAGYGAAAGQFGPDGRFYPVNPPSGFAIETGPDGQVRVVQGVGAQGAAGKPFTEGQSKDIAYATRAEGALATLEPIASALPDRGAILAEKVPLGLARGLQSDQYQMARTAADEFLQAILRKDTGAAITAQEQELYGTTYLPQPGDSEARMAQKAQARRRAVEALKAGMPPAAIIAQEKALSTSGSAPMDSTQGWVPVAPGVRIREKQ